MQTTTWRVEHQFKTLADYIACQVVDGITRYPSGAQELEIQLWNSAVGRKHDALQGKGLVLQMEEVEGRKSLWVKGANDREFSRAMVPGFQYRLARYDAESQKLLVERVIYSEIEALKSPDYRNLFASADLPLPHGPIAPVLYIITADGFIVGTKRGIATNKYPEGIWGIGGDIDDPSVSVGQHLASREEIEELSRGAGAQSHLLTLGIVFDKALRKHDLLVVAHFDSAFQNITKGRAYLPDVSSVTPISVRNAELADFIAGNYVDTTDASDRAWVGKPTAPCSAALCLVGKHLYGDAWAEALMARLPK